MSVPGPVRFATECPTRGPLVLSLVLGLLSLGACAHSTSSAGSCRHTRRRRRAPIRASGSSAGMYDAGEATWNMQLVSQTRGRRSSSPARTNSDLAFTGNYVIQGNYNGYQVWDISQSGQARRSRSAYLCPASQSDVSVYKNLLFVSGEGTSGRLDCGTQGVQGHGQQGADPRHPHLRHHRHRAPEVHRQRADLPRLAHPHGGGRPQGPGQRLRLHLGLGRRPLAERAAGLRRRHPPDQDPNSALFRIEVIKVPLAHPEQAAIVSSPRIFNDLAGAAQRTARRRRTIADAQAVADGQAHGRVHRDRSGDGEFVVPSQLHQAAAGQHRQGARRHRRADRAPTAPPCVPRIPAMIARLVRPGADARRKRPGPTQCHDITVYPAIGLAGGACAATACCSTSAIRRTRSGIGAVADSNFSFWHSATFNNDGTKLLFSDEWGGGGQPKCRATDPKDWGADAIFTHRQRQADVPELLQDAGRRRRQRELRGAQRLADPDPGPRRDGPGVVPGRHVGVRLDRPGAPEGDRLLRPRPDRLDRLAMRRVLVGLLVQRRHRQLRDRAAASTSSS